VTFGRWSGMRRLRVRFVTGHSGGLGAAQTSLRSLRNANCYAAWPLRAGREELADSEAAMPPAKRGPGPVIVSRETRAIAAVERREACALDQSARRAS
jgi:hypothetical protein